METFRLGGFFGGSCDHVWCALSVCEDEGDDPIELPAEEEGTLLLTTLTGQFPGACGLKFRNPDTRGWRGVRLTDGRLFPPTDTGWGTHVYISVLPKGKATIYTSRLFDYFRFTARVESIPNTLNFFLP